MAFATAYYARRDPGETVLVHAAAEGIEQVCIMLAQLKGFNVSMTVDTPEKRLFLLETYGITKTDIFSIRNTPFAKAALAVTDGKGDDVNIFNCEGYMFPYTQMNTECASSNHEILDRSIRVPVRPACVAQVITDLTLSAIWNTSVSASWRRELRITVAKQDTKFSSRSQSGATPRWGSGKLKKLRLSKRP
ncbi:hypothetical protein F5B17DRAFT_346037 [Nemania serpens]|nr:hypothetical protein F5B17DRAFT_346037 [Nemania serpens]